MISKFDAVLIGAFALIALTLAADFWLIVHGLPEFGAGIWTLVTTATTGEVVTFSLYRITKQGGVKTAAKTLFSGSKLIELEDKTDEGKVDE